MSLLITNPVIKINLHKFSGGEMHVQLNQLPKESPHEVSIRVNIQSSDDLMALLLTHNALHNHYGKKLLINLEIPYFPYARQDRVCAIGQAFSLQVVAKLIEDLALNSLTVWDVHSPVAEELTNAINIPQEDIIETSGKLLSRLKDKNAVLVCPDKGAKKKCQRVKDKFAVNEMIYSKKIRKPVSGEITDTQLVTSDLTGKTAIIIDDICDGGRTFIEIAKKLKEKNSERIILYVTHGIFSKGMEVFDGLIDEIFTTNSFSQIENSILNVIDFSKLSTKQSQNNRK